MAKKSKKQLIISEEGRANLDRLRNLGRIIRQNAAPLSTPYDNGMRDPSMD
jgi:hypothetical protein